MACTLPYIESKFRQSNPEVADKLNNQHIKIVQDAVDSNLFRFKDRKLLFSQEGTKKLERQRDYVNNINQQYGVNVLKNVDGVLSVNVLGLAPSINVPQVKEGVEFIFEQNPELANAVYEALGFQGSISLESNLKNTGKTEKELIDYLKNKYPEIKLNISNNPIWEQSSDIVKNQEEYNKEVQYRLKATEILLSDKAKQIFDKGNKNKWSLDKILTELAVPKEQKQLLLDLNINDREQLALELVSKYGFKVEINVGKNKLEVGGWNNIGELSGEEVNSSFYSNLTVPGGTNYTENEIATPAITPSIKGHAQFATDNGIGWFRSDDKVITEKSVNKAAMDAFGLEDEEESSILKQTGVSKTRRILEVQSDLFQKGRDKEDLVSKKGKYYRVLNINLGKDVTFEPKSYSEAFEQGEDGKWYPKYNKYGGYWKSNIPEISASKNIGSAVMGNWTASGMPQTAEFFIYELEDSVEPDYDISHLEIGDFKQLQEVRYRKPVKGKLIGEFKLTPDIYKIFNENYDLMSEDGGINKHYELEDEFEKKYGYRPYDEKAPEGAVEIFNKIQDDYWKEQSLKVEKALQSIHNKYDEQVKQNQFLQLLNKDNNWVTFFVKSIIQDSAKKEYKKVLFPTGNTASKIEGYQTLEEFKKQKEDRIKELEDFINNPTYDKIQVRSLDSQEQQIKDNLDSAKREINQLKQELERVEREGFGALKPIYNFYENTVTNILKKTYGKDNIKQITDEYGNQWQEITINQARDLSNILLQRNEANKIIGQANIKAMTVLVDAVNKKADTIPHEYAHHYIAWFRDTPIVQEGIKRFGSEEALVQAIGEQVVKQKGEAYNWWKKFTNWILNLLSDKQLLQILTDSFLNRQDLHDFTYNQPNTQQKQQAQQLYSQYLDTIFPDSKVIKIDNSLYNSVLNQLEQENKIEKDCSGGGGLKAKDGIRGKFTKGSQWEIYEIFEGKSHKQGGIEINIKNNQINFTNKNGSIKAKYGLVISKDS